MKTFREYHDPSAEVKREDRPPLDLGPTERSPRYQPGAGQAVLDSTFRVARGIDNSPHHQETGGDEGDQPDCADMSAHRTVPKRRILSESDCQASQQYRGPS